MQFGAHVSAAGGLHNAITKATQLGCQVFQIFVSPPQSYKTIERNDEEIRVFTKLYQDGEFGGLFFHAIYLINLASEQDQLVNLSRESLISYLNIGDKLGAVGTIVHLGSFNNAKRRPSVIARNKVTKQSQTNVIPGFDRESIYIDPRMREDDNVYRFGKMIDAIKEIISKTPQNQKLIVENCAGSKIGKDLEELVAIDKAVNSPRLTFCIDTQHLFASGVDVRDYKIFENWLDDFNGRIGIDKLSCVHANDSKTDLGSGTDRHENIGEGKIGKKGFSNILRQPLLQTMPFILEVPGFNGKGPDLKNMIKLKSFVR